MKHKLDRKEEHQQPAAPVPSMQEEESPAEPVTPKKTIEVYERGFGINKNC
ncbi:hypothetical protein [Planococcus wigleyi]|uniref:Uncharacterized protein n=1 Tax=Planococcus wigleyi TaxID=2762216 RepID=A0ABR8WEW1_9BACL|nr:hypothetical protein [Planococcus wigleyi]MBD8015580.1 hypothetical protein [Planococcus wigleyi]